MTQFSDLGLAKVILRALEAEGYSHPTPIQARVIPAMLKGDDLIGIAQTGTGKTASFVLPVLQGISEGTAKRASKKCCKTLILTPTRELAAQIADCTNRYGQFMRQTTTIVVGGVKPGPQIRAVANGVDTLIATPGRLEDLINTGAVSLDETTRLILDEADQMLDLGFMPSIRRLVKLLPRNRQTVLMSATMPQQIRKLAHEILNQPKEIAVAAQSKPIDRIEQRVIAVQKSEKRSRLVEVLGSEAIDRAVVFTRTKHGANKLSQYLEKAGFSCDAIHGNRSQNQRQRTLSGFRDGSIKILVATDVAARGIDIDGVSHVVNFELPNVPEVYVHRIGRTARAGNTGIAISLCDETETGLLRDIEKLIGQSFGAATDGLVAQQPASAAKAGAKGRSGDGQRSNSRRRRRSRTNDGTPRQNAGTQNTGAQNTGNRASQPKEAARGKTASETNRSKTDAAPANRSGAPGAHTNGEKRAANQRRRNRRGKQGSTAGKTGRPQQTATGGEETAGLARMLGAGQRSASSNKTAQRTRVRFGE